MALIIETQVSSTRTCRQCPKPREADDPMDVCPGCLLKGARLDEDGPEEDPIAPMRSAKVRRFGDYEMIEKVGQGAWGVVYKARKISLNKTCALKLLLHADTATPEELERLQIEAETAASLGHPHIVPVFDFGDFEGRHYIAMEFIEGRTLAQKIAAKEYELPRTRDLKARTRARELQRDIAQLVTTMTQATGHAHNCQILHRDIKPGNILLDQKGKAYLSDFGLAKALDGLKSISKSGAVLGTLNYMSPEQAEGKRAGFPSDVFSLGAVLYELLTGRPPFKGDSVGDTLLRLKESDPDDPRVACPLIDNDLASICLKCLEKDSNQRYATAGDWANDLDNWLANKPVKARPIRFFRRVRRWCRREPKIAVMVAALFLLVSAVALLASALLLRETESAIREKQKSARLLEALIDRIDRKRERGEPILVSSGEVTSINHFDPPSEGAGKRLTLAFRLPGRGPDRVVEIYGGFAYSLQTNLWYRAQFGVTFDLRLDLSGTNTLASLIKGEADLARLDPADFVLGCRAMPGLIPMVRELHGTNSQIRGAIVTHPDSGTPIWPG